MKIFAFISERFSNSIMVTQIAADGTLINKFECGSYKIAKSWTDNEYAHNVYKRMYPGGYEIEWVDAPFKCVGLKWALENYKLIYGMEMNCREQQSEQRDMRQ